MEIGLRTRHRDVDVGPELITDAVPGVDELRSRRNSEALRGAEPSTSDPGGVKRGEVDRNCCIYVGDSSWVRCDRGSTG